MDYDKFGICLTLVIVIGVCGYAGIISGELGDVNLGLGNTFDNKQIIPKATEDISNPFFEWCYKMKIDCSGGQ